LTDIAELTIDARQLWHGEQPADRPLVFIDLDATSEWPDAPSLPPCPVIGLGSRDHPFAALLDTVIEPPVTAIAILRQVFAAPNAAAVSVQLLRLGDSLTPPQALQLESMAYGLLQGSAEHLAWQQRLLPAQETGQHGSVDAFRNGPILTIELNRPYSGNSIDRAMRDGLHEAFSTAALDNSIEKIVLQGRGRCFSLGAELSEFGTSRDPATAHAIRLATLAAHPIAMCADRLEARIQGACVGAGLEMAAWAERIIAERRAWFQLPEQGMGILPGAGGCVSISRRIGRQRTALMLLSGKRISSQVALNWGLIDAVVDDLAGNPGVADIV
jgi:enoyl-CoA hydratase/carnithine racemase